MHSQDFICVVYEFINRVRPCATGERRVFCLAYERTVSILKLTKISRFHPSHGYKESS